MSSERVEYEYRGEKVVFIQQEGVIDPSVIGWIDEGEEWSACGATLEDAKEHFHQEVDDNLDH